ncbi:MAG: ABC transporter ATP-binding protein [Bacillota bacterium]
MLFSFREITFNTGIGLSREVSLSGEVDSGEALVVRGPSGAGKSSLIRILARLQECVSGEAFLKGESWRRIPGTEWRSQVHYVAQKPVIFNGSVADNLSKPFETRINNIKNFNTDRAKDIMDQLLLDPVLWDQDAKTLSGGEAARLAIVRSLLLDPMVLILDEPSAALDGTSQKALYGVLSKWLTNNEKAAILVSHNNDYGELRKISFLDI